MKVSIIMSVYNMESYLKKAIDSVIVQTYNDWELIVVDDGSTDKSGAMVDEYAHRDSRIKVIHKANSGLADCRNIAIEMADGDYVAFIDSDDWYEPNYIESFVNFIEEEKLDIAICCYYLDFERFAVVEPLLDSPRIMNKQEALDEIIKDKDVKSYVWNKVFKREMLTDKMPVSYVYEDYATVYKWFINADRVGMLKEPLYHYRQRDNSIVHKKNIDGAFYFFLAEIDRANYIFGHNLAPEMTDWMKTNILKTAVGVGKDIARFSKNYKEYKRCYDRIMSNTRVYFPYKGKLTCRQKIRLALMRLSPVLFYIDMIISYWVKIEKKVDFYK